VRQGGRAILAPTQSLFEEVEMNVRWSRRAGRSVPLGSAFALLALLALAASASAGGAQERPKPSAHAPAKTVPSKRKGVRLSGLPRRKARVAPPRRVPAARPKRGAPADADRRGSYRLNYSGVPYNYSAPWIEGSPRVGSTVNLHVGGWGDAETYYIHLYRWNGSAWDHIGGYYLGYATSMSLHLDASWGNTYIGYHAYAYNSWYGWSGGVWSGHHYVQPSAARPTNTAQPTAWGSFEVGGTAILGVGGWSNAEAYWIDVYRWTASTGWVYVSGNWLGSAASMNLTFGSEWADSYLGYHAWGYNSTAGWSDVAYSPHYYVSPGSYDVPPATDNRDTPGVVRNEGAWGWWLSNDLHATVAHYFHFQGCCATPLVGDWDGDGIDSPGINIDGNRWILSNGYDGEVDHDFYYGIPGDTPLVGDWNGDGLDTIAIRRRDDFYYKNILGGGDADYVRGFGNPTDIPIVGDWNGDGIDTPGVVRDAGWWLSNDFNATVHHFFYFGLVGDRPLVGDWNGDGVDTPGVHRVNRFYLSDDFAGTTHHDPVYGNPGDFPVAGDWNPDPMDSFQDDERISSDEAATFQLASTADETERLLVTRYAPLVWLHRSEANFPASAREWFIKFSELKFAKVIPPDIKRRGRGHVLAIKLGAPDRNSSPYTIYRSGRPYRSYDFTRPHDDEFDRRGLSKAEGFYLDLDDRRRNGLRPDLFLVPTYYHYRFNRTSDTNNFITYWFFYPWNDGVATGNHEGDWERVVVDLDRHGNAVQIALYRHKCHRVVPWGQISVVRNTNHPIVFSAEGSHASYGTERDDQFDSCTDGHLVDSTQAGFAWQTWRSLHNVERQPWYGFGGAWGEKGKAAETTGPLGPGWKSPAPAGW
jgi:hypothetical protein